MVLKQSKLGVDGTASVAGKLQLTLVFFTLGGFFFIFTCLIFARNWGNLWLQIPAEIAIEICWTFWFSGLLFIWWRPRFLRRFYLGAEKRMMRLTRILVYAAALLFVIAIGTVGTLLHLGILPVRPH